jgi:hypothetical protein
MLFSVLEEWLSRMDGPMKGWEKRAEEEEAEEENGGLKCMLADHL